MSPSSNARSLLTDRTTASETTTAKPSNGLIVPFPELISQSNAPARAHRHSKQHGHPPHFDRQNPKHFDAAPPKFPTAASAPISLPKSHIHRTPSELQLEQSLLQAEYSDVRMYARLVRGMTERGAALHLPRGERWNSTTEEHYWLSRKSLMGVVECRQRSILEGGDGEEEEEFHAMPFSAGPAFATSADEMAKGCGRGQSESEWNVGCSFGEDSHVVSDSLTQVVSSQEEGHLPLYCKPDAPATLPHVARGYTHHREVSATSSRHQGSGGDYEDDCVFSLEM